MPITLGCPSCGKRFKARDESAGKKVKCPYCQAAVSVPTAEESARAGAPTAPLPPADAPPRTGPPARPSSPAVASPADWGALPSSPPAPPPPPQPAPELFPPSLPGPGARGKDRPQPPKAAKGGEKADRPAKAASPETPERVAAAGWRSVRRGLFWVQFALLWLAVIGLVGIGKVALARVGVELPRGDGKEWVSIEGYVNAPGPNAVPLQKEDLLNLALYGIPAFVGGVCLVFGRLIASGAPRSSGARGLYGFSAMFALLGLVGLFGWFTFGKLLMKDEERYTLYLFLLTMPLAEFWFLTAVTASGVALKRPRTARAVGVVGLLLALAAFVAIPDMGWGLYKEHLRPKSPDDARLYEQAALAVGWLLVLGAYWRAVRNVRSAAKEYLDTVEGTVP